MNTGFCTSWYQAFHEMYVLLIFYLIEFWFFGVIPKYFKFVTFSKDFAGCIYVAIFHVFCSGDINIH